MLEMLEGAGLFAAGAAVCRVVMWRHLVAAAGRPAPPEPQPMSVECGCSHHASYHAGGTGGCNEKARRGTSYEDGHMTKWLWVDCPCRKFVPKTGTPALTDLTPAELARQKGYDPDYVSFMEEMQREK
jgi:hypothetical protein